MLFVLPKKNLSNFDQFHTFLIVFCNFFYFGLFLIKDRVFRKKVVIGPPKPEFLSETFENFTVGRLFL